jgi:23S rRNA (cytosine1962-C5)-methyltransferase
LNQNQGQSDAYRLVNSEGDSLPELIVDVYGRSAALQAFDFLKEQAAGGERFDLIILDSPKFAARKKDYMNALKGYFELNRMAKQIMSANGILVSCSCSQQVDQESFVAVLNQAAISLGREMKIIDVKTQTPDHTFVPSCPEPRYLKCIISEID